ncbi:MAG: PKD domain-containing protein [Tepidisphaeraceae bacterium]
MMNIDTRAIIGRAVKEALQGLEDRRLFSGSLPGSAYDLTGTTLTVNGTARADTIVVHQDAGANGDKWVTVNGKSTPHFKWGQVFKFVIQAAGGDDHVGVDSNVTSSVDIYAGKGNDTVNTGKGSALVVGGPGNDTLVGGSGNAMLYGNTGKDSLRGGSGTDFLSGDGGTDVLRTGSDGRDILVATSSGDTLYTKRNDTVYGNKKTNKLVDVTPTGSSTDPTPTPTPEPEPTPDPDPTPTPTPDPEPDPKPVVKPSVVSLTLVDAATGQAIKGYENIKVGSTLNLVSANLPKAINVVANTSSNTTSAQFNFNQLLDHTDTVAPFNAADDTGNAAARGFSSGAGTYTITVTPFANDIAGTAISLKLNISAATPTPTPTPTPDPTPTPSDSKDAPSVKFDLSAVTTRAGQAVHVDGTDTTITGGDLEDAKFVWNFGDPNGRFNTLPGFNAAHVYETPGTYTVTLTVTDSAGRTSVLKKSVNVVAATGLRTIYVGGDQASDDNDGTAGERAVKSLAAAMSLVSDDTVILLAKGQTYDISSTLVISQDRVTLSTWGSGDRPTLRWTGPKTGASMLTIAKSAQFVTVRGLQFDTANATSTTDKAGLPDAIQASGSDLVLRENVFRNVMSAINANGQPTRLLVMDNDAPSETGIRAYFLWSQGSDHVVIGNHVANSTREHCVRVGGTDRILLASNDMANLDRRPIGDANDFDKGVFNVQFGSYAYLANNSIEGPWSAGPLGGPTGEGDAARRFQHVRIENNTAEKGTLELKHGLEHVTIVGNTIRNDDENIIDIEGFTAGVYNRDVEDVVIDGNVGVNAGTKGVFLNVLGKVGGGITLTDNRYAAPKLAPGSWGTAVVYVHDTSLASFKRIDANVWPDTGTASPFYINNGYVTAFAWNNMGVVGNDQFKDLATTTRALAA